MGLPRKNTVDSEQSLQQMKPKDNDDPEVMARDGRLQCMKVTAWCFLHTFGLVLNRTSSAVDREMEDKCLKDAAYCESGDKSTLDSGESQKTLIALLTPPQMAIITNDVSNQPLLIVGSAGTGKTFLVMNKIKQLHSSSAGQRITAVSRAMVIAKCDQICLLHTLKNALREYEHVVVEPVDCLSLEELVVHLNNHIPEDIKYVFVDQLEDFVNESSAASIVENQLRLKSGKFDVSWFLWNSGIYANEQRAQEEMADFGKGKHVHVVM